METPDVIKMLTWINSFDGRVQLNEPNVTTWAHALARTEAQHAKTAILEHRRLYATAPAPSEIATRARQLKTSEVAAQRAIEVSKQRAIEAPPAEATSLRQRDPQRWQQLIQAGKQQRETTLKEAAK